MGIKTEEKFQLRAPADRVWAYLIDPRHVVTCLPGAELTSVVDDTTFLGNVKVKVGPVIAAYSGKVVITERDDSARVVRMVGDGREKAGAGSAKVSITSAVAELPGGLTEVRVTADLDIVGRIAQFGRGMIESVNKQMFRQFADCVRATLETPSVEGVLLDSPAVIASAGTMSGPPSPADNTRFSPSDAGATGPSFVKATPVRLLPLLGRAVWDFLTGLVRQVFGRRTNFPR